MSKNYKDVVFPKSQEKKLDKEEKVSYTKKTEQDSTLNYDYKAYAIVKREKKYVVLQVELDVEQEKAGEASVYGIYDSEAVAITKLQRALAEQSKKFRK